MNQKHVQEACTGDFLHRARRTC